jgi:thiamine biosynthesis lipoprotein
MSHWVRRARFMLGTLVEVGVSMGQPDAAPQALAAIDAAWAAIALVQTHMSVFESGSDIGFAHGAAVGQPTPLHPWTAEVLRFARLLNTQSAGLFDVSQGSGRWLLLDDPAGHALIRLDADTRFDLGGVAKGFAVDQAVRAAKASGAVAVWVNAGGDLRVDGSRLPLSLRDEARGGVYPWIELEDGALATSDFSPGARSALYGETHGIASGRHVSVAAPECMVADALTKVLACTMDASRRPMPDLLRHYSAQAWVHTPGLGPAATD